MYFSLSERAKSLKLRSSCWWESGLVACGVGAKLRRLLSSCMSCGVSSYVLKLCNVKSGGCLGSGRRGGIGGGGACWSGGGGGKERVSRGVGGGLGYFGLFLCHWMAVCMSLSGFSLCLGVGTDIGSVLLG